MAAISHIWKIPSFGVRKIIARADPFYSHPQFSIYLAVDNGNSITTELSVMSFAGFNGTNISCSDPNAAPGDIIVQEVTAIIFGEFVLLAIALCPCRLINTAMDFWTTL